MGHVVAMGAADADTDEGAVEMLALSHRDRQLVAETIYRLGYLKSGDDITHACEIVVEALRRGDDAQFWVCDEGRARRVGDGGSIADGRGCSTTWHASA